ncbi:MAG: tRNA lysidine(34) synthetase TilS [Ktedonobacteraceae bacterium]
MQQRVIAFIEQHALLPAHGTVVVAFSGGADSLCLLHILHTVCGQGKRYPEVNLHVAHLNHQLRGEASEQEAAHVAHLADAWNLPYTIGTVDVQALARQEQRSLEDAGRTARYRFLREVAQGQPIAIAHHQDDQVETLLLHWIRGGGTASRIGLQPRQQDIIRPLLAVMHAEIVAYCEQHGLTPIEDASNSDTRFYRNRIRHQVLPLLETMNANFRETLVRNAEVMRVDVEWIETQVEQAWSDVVLTEQVATLVLSIPPLRALSLSIQRHLLRRVTSMLHGGQSPLELRHYVLLEQLLQRENDNLHVSLSLPGSLVVRRDAHTLLFQRTDREAVPAVDEQLGIQQEVTLPIPGSVILQGTPWTVVAEVLSEESTRRIRASLRQPDWKNVLLPSTPFTVYLDAERVGSCLRIRTRRPGDVLRPLGMMLDKKIQDIFIDKHIPRDQRNTSPLFFNTEGQPLWLGGVCIDDRARLTEHTQHIVCLKMERIGETE